MALSQSAVSELLEAFRAGDGVDLVRESVRLVHPPLRTFPRPRHRTQRLTAEVPDDQGRPGGGDDRRSCGRDRSSPASWNPDAGSTRPCTRW